MTVKFLCLIMICAMFCIFISCDRIQFNSDKSIEIKLTEKEINDRINKKFPIEEQKFIFTFIFKEPVVYFEAQTDRLGFKIRISGSINKFIQLNGGVNLTGKIELKPKTGEFYLVDLNIKEMDIEGIQKKFYLEAFNYANEFIKIFFKKVPIYKIDENSDKKEALAKMLLKSVKIKNNKLVLTLGI